MSETHASVFRVGVKPGMHTRLGGVAILLLLAGQQSAPAQEPTPPDTVASREEMMIDEDLDELLAEMSVVSQVPSQAEVRRWLGPGEQGKSASSGSVQWRSRTGTGGEGKQTLQLRWQWPWATGRFKYVRSGEKQESPTGGLQLGSGDLGMTLGRVGAGAGSGLLLARPGRQVGLAADGPLGRQSLQLRSWAGQPDERTLTGMGAWLQRGPVRLQAAAGAHARSADPEGLVLASALAVARDSWQAGCAQLTTPEGRGLSCWTSGKARSTGRLGWSAELASWKSATGHTKQVLQMVTSYQVARCWSMQFGVALEHGGERSPLARRSPFLRGKVGRGWAWRTRFRLGSAARLWLLVHRVEYGDSPAQPDEFRQLTWEIQGSYSLPRDLRLEARLSWQDRLRRQRSQRFPWAVPSLVLDQTRGRGRLRLSGPWGPRDWSLAVTFLNLARPTGNGSRALLSGRLKGTAGGLSWRVGHDLSWGQPVDLVGAINPVPGLVLPRHWGAWQSEIHGGLGLRTPGWEGWLAAAWRAAAPGPEAVDSGQLWLSLSRRL